MQAYFVQVNLTKICFNVSWLYYIVLICDSGETVTIDYCLGRGEVEDGYKRMCQTCSATRTLSSDNFPRIYNEAICYQDFGCFYAQDIGEYYSCRPSYYKLS